MDEDIQKILLELEDAIIEEVINKKIHIYRNDGGWGRYSSKYLKLHGDSEVIYFEAFDEDDEEIASETIPTDAIALIVGEEEEIIWKNPNNKKIEFKIVEGDGSGETETKKMD